MDHGRSVWPIATRAPFVQSSVIQLTFLNTNALLVEMNNKRESRSFAPRLGAVIPIQFPYALIDGQTQLEGLFKCDREVDSCYRGWRAALTEAAGTESLGALLRDIDHLPVSCFDRHAHRGTGQHNGR